MTHCWGAETAAERRATGCAVGFWRENMWMSWFGDIWRETTFLAEHTDRYYYDPNICGDKIYIGIQKPSFMNETVTKKTFTDDAFNRRM